MAYLHISVKAGTGRNAFFVDTAGNVHVNIRARAREGMANKEIVSYLAEIFCLPVSYVIIQKGLSSPHKKIMLLADEKHVREVLNQYRTRQI